MKNNKLSAKLVLLVIISVFAGIFIIVNLIAQNSADTNNSKETTQKNEYKLDEAKTEVASENKTAPVENQEQKVETQEADITKEFFESEIFPMIKNTSGNTSILFEDLNGDAKIIQNENPQKSASVIKLFIMAEAYNRVALGKMSLDEITEDVKSMIQVSDNDATNRLIDKMGMDNINTYIQYIGAKQTKLQRKMLDTQSIEKGIDNYTSVGDVGMLLKKIYNNQLVADYDSTMLEIMSKQTRREKIPSKLPIDENTVIYNKTGEYDKYKIENDVAIIKTEKGAYILCILSDGGVKEEQVALISDISKKIYDFYNQKLHAEKKNKAVENTKPSETKTAFNPSDKIVCIDAGHQLKGNYNKETLAPSSKKTKPKVTSGTQGVVTRINEYEFNLDLAKMLKKDLQKKGYKVVMVRETHDVDISNQQRAQIANNAKSDIYIRIHANGSDNSSTNGIETYYASPQNVDVGKYSKDSGLLSTLALDKMCEKTGAKKRGAIQRDDLTGTNFANMPTTLIEAGYMSNPEEDRKLADTAYRQKIVDALVEAIDEYFEIKSKK